MLLKHWGLGGGGGGRDRSWGCPRHTVHVGEAELQGQADLSLNPCPATCWVTSGQFTSSPRLSCSIYKQGGHLSLQDFYKSQTRWHIHSVHLEHVLETQSWQLLLLSLVELHPSPLHPPLPAWNSSASRGAACTTPNPVPTDESWELQDTIFL